MLLFPLLSLCVTLCCGHNDHEDWTDPTDMFNYDAATGKMIKGKHTKEEKVEAVCEKEDDACPGTSIALMTNPEKSKEVIKEHKDDIKLPESNSNPVFRRYLRKMLNEAQRFGLPEDSSSEVYYNAEMVLSKQMVVEIQKFIDDKDWNLGAFEDALIRTLVQFTYHDVKEWWTRIIEDHLGIDLATTFKILLCILCIVSIIATEIWSRIGWFTQLKRLFIISFMVSVVWNWMYLYKVAFAEGQAELAKQHKFDGTCGEKLSWSESLLEWLKGASTFQNDPCEEYFKSLMINPALMVPPTKALALTFTDFITEPLKHVGKAMGEFLSGLLAEIPVFYQMLVLILIALTFMVSCYGASTTIGPALLNRNNRDPPRERLPPAEPQRPPYGNVVEGHPQPYFVEHVSVYRYPPNQRPESLQAMDTPDDRPRRLPAFTDGDFPLNNKNGGQEVKKEKFIEQKHFREHRGETEEPIQQISSREHQRKALKERSNSPQRREIDTSFAQLHKKEDRGEQKSFTKNLRKSDSIQEVTNSTQQSKTQPLHKISVSQEHQNPPQTEAESPHERLSGQQQRREDSVEEISHGEQFCKEGPTDDKSLELKGDPKRDCSSQKTGGEEFTDVDFPLNNKDGGQGLRKEKCTKEKPFMEHGGKTEELVDQISSGEYQRKALKERSNSPQQRENKSVLETSYAPLHKNEDPGEQKSENLRKPNSIEEVTSSTLQSKTQPLSFSQEQMKVESEDQNPPLMEAESAQERLSGQQQRREDSVEEISHGEQFCKEGPTDDKSLELKGDVKRDPSSQKIGGEEESSHIAKDKETCLEDEQISNDTS